MMNETLQIAKNAKECSSFIGSANTELKNQVLRDISIYLVEFSKEIIAANKKDIKKCRKEGISASLLDRLMLDEKRIKKISSSIETVIQLTDPVGEIIFGYDLPNGLILKNIRVPFGVIGIIYEARPNVTVDASVLCLKAGSCVILRGSSHALSTNLVIVEIMRKALKKNDLPENIVQIIPSADRKMAEEMMQLRDYIDVLIPRGGKDLISSVVNNSKVPVIETGIGNCHLYIDNKLDGLSFEKITSIIVNSKTDRPSVCNAAEKVLFHSDTGEDLIGYILESLKQNDVMILGCERTRKMFASVKEAVEEDWYEEFLDLKIAVKIVDSLEEAVKHINKYGSHHTETIVTSDYKNAMYFTRMTDSSTVFVNASTRFTDGGEFGMGAEIGISTQKMHWRGPMGPAQIMTNKFIVFGDGQIRK